MPNLAQALLNLSSSLVFGEVQNLANAVTKMTFDATWMGKSKLNASSGISTILGTVEDGYSPRVGPELTWKSCILKLYRSANSPAHYCVLVSLVSCLERE